MPLQFVAAFCPHLSTRCGRYECVCVCSHFLPCSILFELCVFVRSFVRLFVCLLIRPFAPHDIKINNHLKSYDCTSTHTRSHENSKAHGQTSKIVIFSGNHERTRPNTLKSHKSISGKAAGVASAHMSRDHQPNRLNRFVLSSSSSS